MDKSRYSGRVSMARARRAVGRMEKLQNSVALNIPPGTFNIDTFQFDGGEVEAQVKRIMLSYGGSGGNNQCTFQLGLFQKLPTTAVDFDNETVVISGAIGNQCWHNETITMRVPKDWYLGLLVTNLGGTAANLAQNLQCNYKVLN